MLSQGLPTRRWPTARSASSAATSSPRARSASSTASTCSTPVPCARWTPKASAPSSDSETSCCSRAWAPARPARASTWRWKRWPRRPRRRSMPTSWSSLRQPRRHDIDGALLDELTADAAERLAGIGDWLSTDLKRYLPCAVRASRAGVGRVHVIGYDEDGTLLRELFSAMASAPSSPASHSKTARCAAGRHWWPDRADRTAGGRGRPGRRERDLLEREIARFSVVEHDGLIVGCAALYPYGDGHGELACLAVHPQYRRWGYGEQLMKRIEARAREARIKRLFVLTTRTAHWFIERGFSEQGVEALPDESAWSTTCSAARKSSPSRSESRRRPHVSWAFAPAASAIIRRSTTALLEH